LDGPLNRAWAVVVPSLWAEPHGPVAVEAIVRGTPVICSASGGLGEIVEDGVSGLTFRNNDEEGLLRCLRRVAAGQAFP
jgi:glycosyltransferase involved in cell wall biosynthesis